MGERKRRRPVRADGGPRRARAAHVAGGEPRVRILVLFGLMCLGFALIGYRLACLQIWWSPAYKEIAREQHRSKVRIEATRGTIGDSAGRVFATTKRVRSVFADRGKVTDPVKASLALAPYLQRSPRDLYTVLTADAGFVYLARQLPDQLAQRVEDLAIPGIGLQTEQQRYYPNGRLASAVLGFAGVDNQGLEGIEYHIDDLLRGQPGWRITTRDVYGRSLPALTRMHVTPQPGANLTLTIDQVVQYHAEQVMRRVLREQRAQSATAVVVEPATGAVLAMVSLPDYDPNDFTAARPAMRRNRTVTDVFEPGSAFKVVAAAAALEAGLVDASTRVYCEDGWYRYYGHIINDTHPMGTVPFADVFAQSSNIGMVKVANLLPPEAMHARILAFGFGQRTGINLPGESPGLYRSPDRWSKLSMGALPIGQEIGVTALQLAVAYAGIANDGVRMQPYVVSTIRRQDGTAIAQTVPTEAERVCSAETARALRGLLARVVSEGTGHLADISGYTVAGKTGTAQKTDPETGRYSREDYVAVFAGMVPADQPRFVCVVTVDSPRGEIWGGKVAAPAFADIAREILQYLEVPPDRPLAPETDPPIVLANHPAEKPALPPDTYLAAGLMPDLTGRTMRDVLSLFSPYPVHVRLEGSGLVVRQTPPPGEPLQPDMTCAVVCASAQA